MHRQISKLPLSADCRHACTDSPIGLHFLTDQDMVLTNVQSQAAQKHIEDLVQCQLDREAACEQQRRELQSQVR
jgi:hypothetical protein